MAGGMADVLVGAKQQAEKIIMETLNGYNFAKQYVAMGNLLTNLSRKKDELAVLKRRVMEVSGSLCLSLPPSFPPSLHPSLFPSPSLPPSLFPSLPLSFPLFFPPSLPLSLHPSSVPLSLSPSLTLSLHYKYYSCTCMYTTYNSLFPLSLIPPPPPPPLSLPLFLPSPVK